MTATLSVSLPALRTNYRLLKGHHAKKSAAAVVKADAYGLGVGNVSRALWEEGCRDFFVATLEEGIELRSHVSHASIAVFSGLRAGEEKTFQRYELIPVLNSLEQVNLFMKAPGFGTQESVMIHVDTGMARLGLSATDLASLVKLPCPEPRLLVMSHLACGNEPKHPKNSEQLKRFQEALKRFPKARASLANSSGLFLPPEFHFDISRPGCALYGINPVEGDNPMRHVATLSAPFLQIRTLDREETVGYGATHKAKKGSRIAIVDLGYADGLLRALSSKGFAFVAGEKVPFAGRVSMDMIALDVSAIPEKKLEKAEAEFISAAQTVSEVAALAGTIGYEIFTRIGKRVKKVYTN